MAAHNSSEIVVRVADHHRRRYYMLTYTCPMTRKRRWKASGIENTGRDRDRKAAERAAADWERELNDGEYRPPARLSWDEFRDLHEEQLQPGLAEKTRELYATVFNAIENILNPQRLADLTAERLSYFQAELRKGGRAEATIAAYLRHLRTALRWATDMGWLRSVPKIQKPPRAKGSKVMRGRPLALEEFERMLAKTEAVVGPAAAECWRFYLRGLWTSGLRRDESLSLFWDRPDRLCIDMTGKRPMLRIPAALEKGNQDRCLPMAPEFSELLATVPEAARKGRVFKLVDRDGNPREFAGNWVGRVVSAIGKRAGVKVDVKGDKVKYASAHDLRRSFGERWARRIMPVALQELMRHESIDTTLAYYVGRNAQATADVLWEAHEQYQQARNTSRNTSPNGDQGANDKPAARSTHDGL